MNALRRPPTATRLSRRLRRRLTLWMLAGALSWPAVHAQTLPAYVDLRADQTPIRNQGGRRTCITFAAIAALEAAYKRAGYGGVDLSEQFTNHLGKTFWLHPYWADIAARGPAGAESQVGAFGGGGGVGYLALLSNGLRVPSEATMPYFSREYTADDFSAFVHPWYDPYWLTQRNQSDFNLDPAFLPLGALKASRYYTPVGYKTIDARSAAAIEAALASKHEVVWDFAVANLGTSDDPVWRSCRTGQAACPSDSHAMVLVGYDRRSANPREHYFIAKNSWGDSGVPGSNGFTYISYDYLQYGIAAAHVDGVKTPATWPELAFVGRWNLDFDGFKGLLDIYHLPGLSKAPWAYYGVYDTDRRLGTYYDASGQAFRVNGSVSGSNITFYIDGANPNAKWDQLGGRRFSYSMVKTPWGEVMAGTHRDPGGQIVGGYARKQGFLSSGTPAPRPLRAASYMGADWAASFNNITGKFRFTSVDVLASTITTTVLAGTFAQGTVVMPARAYVTNADPYAIGMSVPALGYSITGRFHNWEPGVVSGHASSATSYTGFVMYRQ